MFEAFKKGEELGNIANIKVGLQTGNNNKFLRQWFEVDYLNIEFNCESYENSKNSNLKWFPHNKGGKFRKWYGNHQYVINWKNGGIELKNFKGACVSSLDFQLRHCLSWSRISSGSIAFRYYPNGLLFDSASCAIFLNDNNEYMAGFLNSAVSKIFLDLISPTLNYQVGHISAIPIIWDEDNEIGIYVRYNLKINKYLVFCEFDLANINFSFYEIVKHINMCLMHLNMVNY